jgi:hypothetical protein
MPLVRRECCGEVPRYAATAVEKKRTARRLHLLLGEAVSCFGVKSSDGMALRI